MIYVISKSTFGEYGVRDIQCNANWDCCPYSDYALIPEDLVDGILATQGYCDIDLNSDGAVVTGYAARSIPSVPEECHGVNTVLSVNGVRANTNGEVNLKPADVGAAPATEYSSRPGCYYRAVDGESEWTNPPMLTDTEYRTTERYNGMPVYTKLIEFGTLPASGMKTVGCGISGQQIIDMRTTITKIGGSFIPQHSFANANSVLLDWWVNNSGSITASVFSNMNDYSAFVQIKYIQ